MTISSTERAGEKRPHRAPCGAAPVAWAAPVVAALVAVVALLATPQVAAAKYGSPLVTHVTTAGGRGGVYLAIRADRGPSARTTRVVAMSGTHAAPAQSERRGTSAGLRSHSDLGNGIVLARSARPVQQIVVALSELVATERTSRFAATTASRADEFQHAAGQAHRLRGPPSLLA